MDTSEKSFNTHTYLDGPPKQVPGFSSLHRMVGLLLAEHVPSNGRILILGAGGGMEIRALAQDYPGWFFDGIDPSQEMLNLAAKTVEKYSSRANLHRGYINTAPPGPFDGAVSLLTMHFIPRDQRLDTLKNIHKRLRKGAPLVIAHISIPSSERSQWITRHLAFSETAEDIRTSAAAAMNSRLSILSPDEDETLLRGAGFSSVSLFYAGFSFRGWVAYAT